MCDITTVKGEIFTFAESCQLAKLILKRFGDLQQAHTDTEAVW
jgi:hypothetical protein